MTKQPTVKYETHTLTFPYANVIFGRVFQLPCEVLFQYSENKHEEIQIIVKSLVGKSEDGVEYDLIYLTEDTDSLYSEFIINCILTNKQHWDTTGEREWWEL